MSVVDSPPAVTRPATGPPLTRRRPPAALGGLATLAAIPAAIPLVLLAWTVATNAATTGGVAPRRIGELLVSTGLLVVAVTVTTTVLGVSIAWLTTRTDLRGSRVWTTLLTLPLVIPSYVGALTFLGASGSQGLISVLLAPLGLGPVPTFTGFTAAWLALSLWNYPFVLLIVRPALQRMHLAVEEAAASLGAGQGRILRTLILPRLRPAIVAAGLLVGLYVLSDFGAVSLLRYETFTRAIYTQFRGRLDMTPALFLSGVLVLLALGIVVASRRARGRSTDQGRLPGRGPLRTPLTRTGRVAATAYLSSVALASLGLPLLVLGWWALRGIGRGIDVGTVTAEIGRTVLVGAVGALVIVVAALPLAILDARHPGRLSAGLESMTWATYSLPHLAVGLAFMVGAIRLLPAVYQSFTILVAAYVAMFLPQASGALRTSLLQVGPDLEEASHSLGRSALTTHRRIVLPLIAPGMLAGGALAFLTIMKELPATLLLRPTGFETLAIRIWSASSESLYTRASVAALVLVAISAVPLYLLTIRDRT